jgi:hypothetical protein
MQKFKKPASVSNRTHERVRNVRALVNASVNAADIPDAFVCRFVNQSTRSTPGTNAKNASVNAADIPDAFVCRFVNPTNTPGTNVERRPDHKIWTRPGVHDE